MGNSFGHLFRITTWGESHGDAVGVVIDGCPPRVPISLEAIQRDLDRRRPGQSDITTQRREPDRAEILSGVFEGVSLGSPISILVRNEDIRSKDYEHMRTVFRPSHADYTYQAKYGIRNWKGGGRASARETIGRVAAGAVARSILAAECGVDIVGYVKQVWALRAEVDTDTVTSAQVEANEVRCPDPEMARRMIERIKEARKDGDSLGGIVECVARNVPPGLGDPVFDKLEADLGKGLLSLPACKGFEVGSGFGGVTMSGSQHNDPFYMDGGRVRTRTNRSGGIQGGIS
ncbi:MAG: chorismate synthase, partial [SAR202 cluster bacterium]|nr:chorismate synthase [SAR202 cluster bacterium]